MSVARWAMPPAPPLKVALVARLLWSKGVDLAVEAVRLARAQGARVELTAGSRTQSREVNPFGSFLSQSSYDVMFGLGDAEAAERIVVRWPSGTVDEIDVVEGGRRVMIVEGEGLAGETP